LVIGGQVKVSDLSRGTVRQRGIQEVDGVAIASPVTVASRLLDEVIGSEAFVALAEAGSTDGKGPVFIEIPLDIQASNYDAAAGGAVTRIAPRNGSIAGPSEDALEELVAAIGTAERPVLLLGGGVSRAAAARAHRHFEAMGLPIMTTWNGADRVGSENPYFFGRPNIWGQRYANLLIQQSDFIVALGTRLGLRQTGFKWREYTPLGKIAQVHWDRAELSKGHPYVEMALLGCADRALEHLAISDLGAHAPWLAFCREVKEALPLSEAINRPRDGFISPYEFCGVLSGLCESTDIVVPCSSGGASTVMMQAFNQRLGQIMPINPGLASMGYGLSGAIGAAFAGGGRRTVLVEGDGGFLQNIQEIGTAAINDLNLKIFIFDNGGYASIRTTQENYFDGHFIGCDRQTGLGLPDWVSLFKAFDVPCVELQPDFPSDGPFLEHFGQGGTTAFVVPIDPEQTYFPKISRRDGIEPAPSHVAALGRRPCRAGPALPAGIKLNRLVGADAMNPFRDRIFVGRHWGQDLIGHRTLDVAPSAIHRGMRRPEVSAPWETSLGECLR
jgi:acetolactate synthase-1/2/3 large subunit